MKTIELGKFESLKVRGVSKPFAIFFVYPQHEEPFVIKGMSPLVHDWMNKYLDTHNCIYNCTYWRNGICRWVWLGSPGIYIHVTRLGIVPETHRQGVKKFEILVTDNYKLKTVVCLRRMPKAWIKQLDQYFPTDVLNSQGDNHAS